MRIAARSVAGAFWFGALSSAVAVCFFLICFQIPSGLDRGTKGAAGKVRITVVPITHSKPASPDDGILVPPKVRQHLGLDNEPQWVIIGELNEFDWPGPDIFPVPGGRYNQFEYGFLPPAFFDDIVAAILALNASALRDPPERGLLCFREWRADLRLGID